MTQLAGASNRWVVKALYTYPVKSCQGVALDKSVIGETGLAYDRLWMVINSKTGRFVTQRQVPELSLVGVKIDEAQGILELSAPSVEATLRLPLHPQRDRDLGEKIKVRVWYDDVIGRCCGDDARAWFAQVIGKPARLVYKDPDEPRLVSRYLPKEGSCETPPKSGFADVFPFHITTDQSLEDVNSRVPRLLTHRHFRPNIVLSAADSGCCAYDEETWKRIEFDGDDGQHESWSMFITSRTPRCSMPNVDLDTGTMHSDGEPMRTLRTFRLPDPGKPTYVCFGMQAAPQRVGQNIRVGQAATVVERGYHSFTEPL
ncbi:hypothetical protein LPJ56_000128 [Coemansia sp. RSA 2599]|nr:hypothetical protein LPJ75_003885 [Coemansia sp. RSA 2598]KAJ1829816.1 hypothetical protein LPJ56_000128 [Coemansia sp. RSA 2599]